MESSQVLGDSSGKKHSDTSESGWTMYIGSQILNDKKDHNTTHLQHNDHNNDEEESDDSMASDASSGPIDHNLNQIMINPSGTNQEASEVFCGLKSSTGNLEPKQCKGTNKKIRGDYERKRVRRLSEKRFLDNNNNNNDHQQQQNVPEADSCESQV